MGKDSYSSTKKIIGDFDDVGENFIQGLNSIFQRL